jgi:hypothetical protein
MPSGTEVPVVRLRAEPYSLAYYSAMQESQRLVVRDADTWSSVWAGIVGSQSPAPAPPAIDFSKEMVVVASLGARPSGGYSILVQAATMTDDGLYVQVRTISPGRNCAVTAALTQPVDVARLPATDRAVHFVEDPIVKDCE